LRESKILDLRRTDLDHNAARLWRTPDSAHCEGVAPGSEAGQRVEAGIVGLRPALHTVVCVSRDDLSAADSGAALSSDCPANRAGRVLRQKIAVRKTRKREEHRYRSTGLLEEVLAAVIHLHLQ